MASSHGDMLVFQSATAGCVTLCFSLAVLDKAVMSALLSCFEPLVTATAAVQALYQCSVETVSSWKLQKGS